MEYYGKSLLLFFSKSTSHLFFSICRTSADMSKLHAESLCEQFNAAVDKLKQRSDFQLKLSISGGNKEDN